MYVFSKSVPRFSCGSLGPLNWEVVLDNSAVRATSGDNISEKTEPFPVINLLSETPFLFRVFNGIRPYDHLVF